MVTRAKPFELKEIDKIIFKGKVLSIVNEAILITNADITNEIFKSSESYIDYLTKSLIILYESDTQISNIELFLNSVFKFGSGSFNQVCQIFFQKEYWNYFTTSFQVMKSFQKREFTKKFFTDFLVHIVNESNVMGMYNLLLFTFDQIDEFTLEFVVQSSNKSLVLLVAALLFNYPSSKLDTMTLKLLTKWSEQTYIKNEPISIQESRTFMIMQLLSRRKGSDFTKGLPKNKVFLDAISNRLLSFSNNVKALGVVLADHICELNGEEKIFKLSTEVDAYSSLIQEPFP